MIRKENKNAMLDFLMISTRSVKRDLIEIYPKFIIGKSSDLMIRGGDFYAIWLEEKHIWSTDEGDVIHLIDKELKNYLDEHKGGYNDTVTVCVRYMWDAASGSIDAWHKYVQKQMRDSYHILDENLVFENTVTRKEDYSSKKLPYSLTPCDISAYESLMSTLYSDEERHKIEWAIGAVVSGDSKLIQKFLVFYGAAGTGKSTVLNIIQKLFDGYYSTFDAKALGSSNSAFALEAFKTNPLVAIQHDGDLSRIEDNTRINSLVSHEWMTVNEKFKSTYTSQFKCFLFMGTNKPVKITDARSGLIRRLIDVSPSGKKIPVREYHRIMKQIDFSLGGIACHCQDVYLNDPGYYDKYIPVTMLGASNDFYNFIIDSYFVFEKEDGTTLKAAWEMYKTYCTDANVAFPYSQRVFKEELKNYFLDYKERYTLDDGTRVRNYYCVFKADKYENSDEKDTDEGSSSYTIDLKPQESIFDKEYASFLAQYGNAKQTPANSWDTVKTTLSEIDTSKLHYVRIPENHIVIDFDIPDDTGEKSLQKNVKEASKWPPTYAETSKSGNGIHLHYLYSGDVSLLKRIYKEHIEIKIFNGKSSLRRKLSLCNNLPIATISSGLPVREAKMVNETTIKNEKGLRSLIKKNLNKEIHPGTKPSIDFIYKILSDAYDSKMIYDVTDMRGAILAFAASSSHQSDYCIKLVNKMKFQSEESSENPTSFEKIIFFDVEVFPNLFVVDWKLQGDPIIHHMINPSSSDIEALLKFRLVGFNCRRYDNHIMYARLLGYTNEQLYHLSKAIIGGESKNCFFREAYNLSYTDIYDFSSKKQSLKKFEIELQVKGVRHHELNLDWNQPVPEKLWNKVADYCEDDVIATEATFNSRKADFVAREILADIAGMSVNDTTNTLTTKIIFGNDRKAYEEFNYRNMGDESQEYLQPKVDFDYDPDYTWFTKDCKPIFPGYTYDFGKSHYRGEEFGEGGYVYASPGTWGNVALLDIASMHPHSIIAEELFGPVYTPKFQDLVNSRIYIKHKDFEEAGKLFDGKLSKYLTDPEVAKSLAYALKIAINSVYGLTSAKFENPFRDPRNKDNIVAKRGELFMINLKHEVMNRGFEVAHIKTDSIKIPDATPEIIKFVMDYGKMYGYDFEHEATYDRMCLVNDAVYIAKFKKKEDCVSMYGYAPDENKECSNQWTATGTQFQVPYVFKTLFTKEDILFHDLCETKTVTSMMYLDFNENLPDVTEFEELKKYRKKYPDWTIAGKSAAKKAQALLDKYSNLSDEELDEKIAEGHNYQFVGKVGSFCPVKPGKGGGLLMRYSGDAFYAVTGSKGYRWKEADIVSEMNDIPMWEKLYNLRKDFSDWNLHASSISKEDSELLEKYKDLSNEDLLHDITAYSELDKRYYESLAQDALESLTAYGDSTWFLSDDPYFGPDFKDDRPIYTETIPFN